MTLYEQLSALQTGDLPPDKAAALRQRIETEPEVAAAWARLQALDDDMSALLASSPPPVLHARLVPARRPWGWGWVPWATALAAAVALLWLQPAPAPELLHAGGLERVEGEARVVAGDVVVEVDGVAEIEVEPLGPVPRGVVAGGSMERRKQIVAALAGAAVTVVVYEGGARVWAADGTSTDVSPGETLQIGEQPARPMVTRGAPVGDPALRDRLAQLELENRILEGLLNAQDVEFRGTPMPWPDDLPEALTPDGFDHRIRDAVAECAPELEVLGVECSEPPCLAMLRTDGADDWWSRLVNECPTWVDAYSSTVASASDAVHCPDGTEQRMQLLGWSRHLIEETHPLTEEEQENSGKRFRTRIAEIKDAWPCSD